MNLIWFFFVLSFQLFFKCPQYKVDVTFQFHFAQSLILGSVQVHIYQNPWGFESEDFGEYYDSYHYIKCSQLRFMSKWLKHSLHLIAQIIWSIFIMHSSRYEFQVIFLDFFLITKWPCSLLLFVEVMPPKTKQHAFKYQSIFFCFFKRWNMPMSGMCAQWLDRS